MRIEQAFGMGPSAGMFQILQPESQSSLSICRRVECTTNNTACYRRLLCSYHFLSTDGQVLLASLVVNQ